MKNAEIDWSKAPEWATVRLQNRHDTTLLAWAERYEENARFIRGDATSIAFTCLAVNSWDVIAARPQPWNGEGLPPVGAVCLVSGHGANEYWAHHAGKEVTIVAHDVNSGGGECAVYSVLDSDGYKEYHALIGECFHPTRTPEQLAAEARKQAIAQMVATCPYPGSASTKIDCETLYDAGYRKTRAEG